MMFYKTTVTLLLFLLLSSVSLFAEESKAATHRVKIEGKPYFDQDSVIEAMGAKERGVFHRDEIDIDDRLLPTLVPTLKHFYESEGFYDAAIVIREDNDTVITRIDAGEPVRVADINISSDFDIAKLVSFVRGERFTAKKFVTIKAEIIKALLDQGYCSYKLDTKAYIDLEKKRAQLRYDLRKGGICTFGETTVEGLKTIDKDVILSRVRAKKGERYSTKKIKETYSDIYALGSFDRVTVNHDRKILNVIPLHIAVEEISKPYHYEIGAGYDSYIGARVHGKLVKKNFLGNAQKASVRLAWSQKEQLAIVDFFKPALFWAFGYGVDLYAQGGYSNLEYIGFREEKSFTKAALSHEEGEVALRLGVALENVKISLLSGVSNLNQAINEGYFLLFYPYMQFVYDARDDKLNPREGYYFETMLEYALPYKPDTTDYLKSYIEGRVVHTLFDKLTLAAVAKVGAVHLISNQLPESKLFFAGGSFSNRAYGYNTIGVILSPTVDTINGASSMLNLSFEADYPLWGNLYGALFTDNTMLTENTYDFNGEVITSAGVGLRYMTPIGPFKLDIGYNVHKPSQYGISFQIGQSF